MIISRIDDSSIDASALQAIEKLLDENPSTFFHEPGFNRIVQQAFHTDLFYLLGFEDGELVAFCPVHGAPERNILYRLYSPHPLTAVPYGGWVFSNTVRPESLKPKLGSREAMVFRSFPLSLPVPTGKGFRVQELFTPVIDLSQDEDILWKNSLNRNRRRKINEARKRGVAVVEADEDTFSAFADVVREMEIRAGLTPIPVTYYRDIWSYATRRGRGTCLLAIDPEGKVLSSLFVVSNQYLCHNWVGARSPQSPNWGHFDLLHWGAILWAKKQGNRYYDLCTIDETALPEIAQFKLGFSKHVETYQEIVIKPFIFKCLNKSLKLLRS